MIRASDLLGCVVCTESGTKLGRVHDLRAHADGSGGWLLMGLVIGGGGLRERLATGDDDPTRGGDVVAWQAVTRLSPGVITVRDEIAAAIT
jgi:sporulation protein YlmC with PRC-barrel domain